MSVRENLRVADMNGAKRAAPGAEARVASALEFVDMGAHRDAVAGLLSYGQRKLVELAMVLVQAPKLILLDEPVAGVNPVLVDKIGRILMKLAERGQTLLGQGVCRSRAIDLWLWRARVQLGSSFEFAVLFGNQSKAK